MKRHIQQLTIFAYFFLIYLLPQNLNASHLVGSEISYSCTATPNVYLVTMKLYRDCSSTTQLCSNCPTSSVGCNIPLNIMGAANPCNGTNFGTQTLNILGSANIYDAVQLCSISKSICSNCGTRTVGTYTPGIEVYTFQGNINFSALPANCCMVRLGFNGNVRNTGITTISNPGNVSFYSEAIINRCASPCNSSPVFTTNPEILLCNGIDATVNVGAMDPDGDSLSFALGASLGNAGTPVPYSSPYSATAPLPYLGVPAQSPPAILPNGIYINKLSGDIQFRPNGTFISDLVVEVKQWRNISMVPTLMGTTRRDLQVWSQNCPSNSPVSLLKYDSLGASLGAYGYPGDSVRLCPGSTFCRTFVARDTSLSDTTDLIWNNTNDMTGSSVTPLYNPLTRSSNGPRLDSIRFCWTVPQNAGRSNPYLFVISGKDRNCNLPAVITRSVSIYVPQSPNATIVKTSINSSTRKFKKRMSNFAYYNTALTQWQIENTPGSNTYTSINADSVNSYTFPKSGRYKIKLLLTFECGVVNILDSVDINFINLSLVSSQNITCKNDSGGQIIVSSTGGGGTVLYRVNNSAWQSSGSFLKLLAGTYKVMVKDSFNNQDSLSLTLTEPSVAIALSAGSLVNNKCKGDSIGSASLTATNGLLPLQYKVLGKSYQSSNIVGGLSAGLKTFYVMDSLGCTATTTASIGEPNNKLVASLSIIQPLCFGGTGSATLTASGGNSPYQFNIDGGGYNIVNTFPNLTPKSYTFKVKDWNNCELTYQGNVVEPPLLVASGSKTNITCFGANNGSVSLSATGGTKPYQYKKGSGTYTGNPVFNNLAAGNYTFTVSDSNACTKTVNLTITEPSLITKTISGKNASCLGANNGSASIVLSGGVLPYQYSWNTIPVQTGSTAIGLKPGYAVVTITDSNMCVVKDSVLIGYKPIYNNETLCAVSTDTASGAHLVMWSKTPGVGIASYKILGSLNVGGPFGVLDSIPFNNNSLYLDNAHNNKAYYYQLKAVDSCSNESVVSATHNNLFLSLTASGISNILNWTTVVGPTNATGFNVLRSLNGGPFVVIKQLPFASNSYKDSLPPAGLKKYLIELILSSNCNPGTGAQKIVSNLIDPNAKGIQEQMGIQGYFEVYPNPSQGNLRIGAIQNGLFIQSVAVLNVLGASLKEIQVSGKNTELQIDLNELPDGIYNLLIMDQKGNRYPSKIVLSK